MALPKRKKSRARVRSRRAKEAYSPVQWISCPSCGEPTLPHRMCPRCGKYRGRLIREVEEE